MAKLIDASAVIAAIDKIIEERKANKTTNSRRLTVDAAVIGNCMRIKDIINSIPEPQPIDSLQQEQPCEDLEKEFQEFCKDYPFPWSSAYINAEYIEELCKGVAKHFYELGNRSHWKPSEEQIECLRKTLAKETGYERTILRSLFQELITLL